MARSRKRVTGGNAEVGGTPSASAVAAPVPVAALCFGEVVMPEGRTVPGRWYDLAPDVAAHWESRGAFVTQATIDALWNADGRVLTPDGVPTRVEAVPMAAGSLRVLQVTHYDPGSAVYRYHSAANSVPGVVSAFARVGHSNPHCDLRQWDIQTQVDRVRILLATADVVHCHMDYSVLLNEIGGLPNGVRAAITYHGSVEAMRPTITFPEADARMRSIVFGARPYHRRFGEHVQWLPIPMPVADYAALANVPKAGPFRIAHSPTRREIKGTDAFLAAVETLNAEGVAVEAVLIEGMAHGDALRRKATCHATFDSFWLGMQGSGLEAASMGQAVIAGTWDADCGRVGLPVPWTVADDPETLTAVLRRLATDAAWYRAEAARVNAYVQAVHDYPVVGTRYRDILREAMRGTTDRQ
jgi:hypothetical protein